MRQQLRLRVLVPVAVLGLLGAGFGAFAMGGPATPVSSPVLPTSSAAVDTGATDTGAVDTAPTTTAPAPTPPPPPSAGEVDPAAWAQQANALCTQLNSDMEALGEFESPTEAAAWFTSSLELLRKFEADFKALGWPKGEEAAVAEFQASQAEAVAFGEQFLAAIEAGDGKKLVKLAEEEPDDKAAANKLDAKLRELGATECAKNSKNNLQIMRASALLQWQLMMFRAVVVVFYSPDSPLDAATVLEARAAALDTDAGFLPVDVTKEDEVAAIAVGYEITGSPTVLVVSRGPKLRSEFTGYVDRETVAQAVVNARQ